jgi:hypothetical protein
MRVTRKSMMSGVIRSMDLEVTLEQLEAYASGALAQVAFPNLSKEHREFIMTGTTQDEWDDAFSEEET